MLVIATGEAKSSNKPTKPEPIPEASLYPTQKVLPDGRTIWISLPQADYLTLVIPITPKVYSHKTPKDVPVDIAIDQFGKLMLDPPFPAEVGGKVIVNSKHVWRASGVTLGGRESLVQFQHRYTPKAGHRLQIDLNPRKLRKGGIEQLLVLLAKNGVFDPLQFLAAARVTRLDIAVDVVGLHVAEVLLFAAKGKGKRSIILGPDGRMETLYVHSLKKPPVVKEDEFGPIKVKPSGKPLGTLALRAYDRVRERATVAKPPPFGPVDVTRIEIVTKPRAPKNALSNLLKFADPFASIRAGCAMTQMPATKAWKRFCALARSLPPVDAAEALNLSPLHTKAFLDALQVPNSDLVAKKGNWSSWSHAAQITGLELFLPNQADLALSKYAI